MEPVAITLESIDRLLFLGPGSRDALGVRLWDGADFHQLAGVSVSLLGLSAVAHHQVDRYAVEGDGCGFMLEWLGTDLVAVVDLGPRAFREVVGYLSLLEAIRELRGS